MIVTYDGVNRFSIRHRGHVIPVESPARPDDTGMEPADIFSGVTGACVGYYVLAYCRKHDLDPTGLRIEVSFEMAGTPHRLGKIATRVIVPAGIGQEHHAAITAYAHHCLLHQTLLNPLELPLEIVTANQ